MIKHLKTLLRGEVERPLPGKTERQVVYRLLHCHCSRLVGLRCDHRTLASATAVGFHGDQVSAPDFSNLHRQRRGQWNAGASSGIGSLVQTNGVRDFNEFRDRISDSRRL